jgi:serine/threonine protein phosphatase PrpC
MPASPPPYDRAALFGEDQSTPYEFAMHGLASGQTWCSLSVGGLEVLKRKGGATVPNEDALCVIESGDRVLLAVADGHFGHDASHDVIQRLDEEFERRSMDRGRTAAPAPRPRPQSKARGRAGKPASQAEAKSGTKGAATAAHTGSTTPSVLPESAEELAHLIAVVCVNPRAAAVPGPASQAPTVPDDEQPRSASDRPGATPSTKVLPRPAAAGPATEEDPFAAPSVSETTLVVVIVDRARGVAYGVSVGDSSAVVVGLESGVRWLTSPTRTYLDPNATSETLEPALTTFEAPVRKGEVVLAFSDGVNECRYGVPDESIQASHLESFTIRAGGNVERLVEELSSAALAGVDGHRGGEDNVAIAATRA